MIPGKKPASAKPSRDAEQIKTPGAADDHHGRRDQPPADQDPSDPTPGADAAQNQVAGDLENEIADVENAGSQRIGPLPHLEIVEHLQAGEADVDAVQDVDDVKQKQKGKQAPGDFAQHNSLQGVLHALPFPSDV